MTPTTTNERVREQTPATTRFDSYLGHPLAFLATAAILLALFGASFVTNPDRVAPTKDPAYYSWRTEALITEDPQTLLEVEGAFDMFAGGYRVSVPILGGYLMQVAGMSVLQTIVLLMVVIPAGTALLLGGFAYRRRRDPLIFHVVAFGAASLYLTPPFVGYLDNVLALFFLAASLFFLEPSRRSWGARAALALFMIGVGLTHPTTLAIFGLTLGAMAAVRWAFRGFEWRSVMRDDGPMLVSALAGAAIAVGIWVAGIWGPSASLTEAALPPPYDSSFFVDRMMTWVRAMNPLLNVPLFLLGVAGLLLVGRRWVEDELARVSVVWLAPLLGLFGFIGGLTYPYYRFFNTTLAWILLVGVGAYFAARFFINRAARGGIASLSLIGVAGIAFVFYANFSTGLGVTNWNNQDSDWLSVSERSDLLALERALDANVDPDRPVVFVIDDRPARPFQIWGFTKLSGNQSRFALPDGQIDRGYMYLGTLENYLQGRPTLRNEQTYDKLSRALLDDLREGIDAAGAEPLTIVASMFNPVGPNAELIDSGSGMSSGAAVPDEIWFVDDGRVVTSGGAGVDTPRPHDDGAGVLHLLRVAGAIALLLVPGALILRWVLPGAGVADAVGLVPALAMGVLTVVGLVVLAATRAPFSAGLAWASLGIAIAVGAMAIASMRSRPAPITEGAGGFARG